MEKCCHSQVGATPCHPETINYFYPYRKLTQCIGFEPTRRINARRLSKPFQYHYGNTAKFSHQIEYKKNRQFITFLLVINYLFIFVLHINLFSKTPILQIVCNRHAQRQEFKYRMAQTTIPALPTFSQNYVAVLRIDTSLPLYIPYQRTKQTLHQVF